MKSHPSPEIIASIGAALLLQTTEASGKYGAVRAASSIDAQRKLPRPETTSPLQKKGLRVPREQKRQS